MCKIVSRVRVYLTPRYSPRLLLLPIIGCLLLVLVIQPHSRFAPTGSRPTEGHHRGRPIRDLWARHLPEQAWFSNSQCRHFVTRFTRDHSLPLVYLVSFPRSGNTWTRYLLEASTGLFTCVGGPEYAQYRNASYRNATLTEEEIWKAAKRGENQWVDFGYLGERLNWTQGNTIVARSQTWPQPWGKKEADSIVPYPMAAFPDGAPRRAVLIIRDPFKSFISLQKYGKTRSMLNDADMTELFRGEKWEEFVVAYAQIWYELYARWLEYTNETHVITYDNLTRDPIGELTKLLHFLGVEPDPRRMECVRRHVEGKVHNRIHGVVPDHERYPLRQRAELWSHIHQLNWALKDKGFPPLPLQNYSFADEFSDIHLGV